MAITCLIYGLGLEVNVPLAGLAGLPTPARIDVRMTIGSMPPELQNPCSEAASEYFVSPYLDEHDQPGVRVSLLQGGKFHRVAYSDGTRVVVDAFGTGVWATGAESASVEDTATYLLGPILGFVLRLRGVTCLHASAVAIDGQAIALVGTSGAGKSSTAAAFARLGYPVLTDDVLALSDHGNSFDVQPAYPRVRLWSESAIALFGGQQPLPLITPNWDKHFLDLNGPDYQFQDHALPLSAVYFLGERSNEHGNPKVEVLSSREALMALVADTSVTYLLDSRQRAQEFEVLGRLVANVALRRVTPSVDLDRISELCVAIMDDLRSRPTSSPG